MAFSSSQSTTLATSLLNTTLLQLSEHEEDSWRIRDAVQGCQIFGGSASGKTSGSGAQIALSFLRNGFGGLVLTASKNERLLWEAYARATGREQDLIIFSPEHPWRFNFLRYEQEREGESATLTENLVALFVNALEANRFPGHSTNEAHYQNSLRQLLRNGIDLLKLAGKPVSLPDLYKAISTAPLSMEQARDASWQKYSDCATYLEEAYRREDGFSAIERNGYAITLDYFLNHFPRLADQTRSIVVSTFLSMADGLLRGLFRDLFCGDLNIRPDVTYEGKIIVLDLPVKHYFEIGQYAQIIFKHLWQQAAEGRKIEDETVPIFLWCNESQLFVTSYDAVFQSSASAARVCTVYLTQTISNYQVALEGSTSAAEVLLENIPTVIFHNNTNITTNQYASTLIGQKLQRSCLSTAIHRQPTGCDGSGSQFLDCSTSCKAVPQVLPMEFSMLKKGGHHHNFEVDAIVFQSGRKWQGNGGKSYAEITFKQGKW